MSQKPQSGIPQSLLAHREGKAELLTLFSQSPDSRLDAGCRRLERVWLTYGLEASGHSREHAYISGSQDTPTSPSFILFPSLDTGVQGKLNDLWGPLGITGHPHNQDRGSAAPGML